MDIIKELYQQLEKMQTDEERIDQLALIANRFMYIDLDRFEVVLQDMKQLAEKANSPLGIYHYHYGIGRLHIKRMDYQKALVSFEKAHDIAKGLGSKKFLATILYSFAIAKLSLGRFQEALADALTSVQMFKSLKGEHLNLSVAYCYVAMCYDTLGKYPEAEKAYLRSVEAVSESDDIGTRAGSLVNYGVFKVKLKDYDKALELYLEALNLLEKSNNKLLLSQTLVNIGELYFLMGDNNEALTYCVTALKMLKHMDNKKALIKVYICLAEIYMAMGGLKEAAQKLKLISELMDNVTAPFAQCHVAGVTGELYFRQGKIPEAKALLQQANDIAITTGLLDMQEKYGKVLAQVMQA